MAPAASTSASATSATSSTTSSATASPSPTASAQNGFRTASIVAIVIFSVLAFIAICSVALFYIQRRRHHASLPHHLRPTSTYRPYRSSSNKKSDSSGLLANVASPDVDDKSTMFSRDRSHSSATLSLYVPEEHENASRISTSSLNLVPIIVSPAEEIADPSSDGSGVGGRRGRGLSIRGDEEQDLGVSRGRIRSSSTASTRYYDTSAAAPPPPVPTYSPS